MNTQIIKAPALKLTKLESFLETHPNLDFYEMARQLNRSFESIERAFDRIQKKEREQLAALVSQACQVVHNLNLYALDANGERIRVISPEVEFWSKAAIVKRLDNREPVALLGTSFVTGNGSPIQFSL